MVRVLAEVAAPVGNTLDITAVYRRYGDMVLGRCRSLVGDPIEAQDVMQQVFLKLHRYSSSYRGDASISTYLFRITTTTCLNHIRGRSRRREDPVEHLPPTASTESGTAPLEVRQLVDQLLRGEDEKTQTAVVYHYVDGMTYDEIGELQGVSGAAIRKRVSRFRSRARANPPSWLIEEA